MLFMQNNCTQNTACAASRGAALPMPLACSLHSLIGFQGQAIRLHAFGDNAATTWSSHPSSLLLHSIQQRLLLLQVVPFVGPNSRYICLVAASGVSNDAG